MSRQPQRNCEIGMVGLGVMGRNLVHNGIEYFGAHSYECIDAKGTFHTE